MNQQKNREDMMLRHVRYNNIISTRVTVREEQRIHSINSVIDPHERQDGRAAFVFCKSREYYLQMSADSLEGLIISAGRLINRLSVTTLLQVNNIHDILNIQNKLHPVENLFQPN